MKLKKLFLSTSAAIASTSPVVVVISCSDLDVSHNNYDFGVSIPAINNLNYIKNDQLYKLDPTLIQGIFLKGPGSALSNQLQLPSLSLGEMDAPQIPTFPDLDAMNEPTFSGTNGQGIYPLSDFGIYSGNIKTENTGIAYATKSRSDKNLTSVAISLNGKQSWKGNVKKFNRPVEAQDYIDYFKYITDINVGSPHMIWAEDQKVKGIADFIAAQKAYIGQYGTAYKNPWGVNLEITPDFGAHNFINGPLKKKMAAIDTDFANKYFPSQNAHDLEARKVIIKAAMKFMLEGMRTISSGAVIPIKNSNNDTRATDFYIGFEEHNNRDIISVFESLLNRMKPVNKEFIDYIGGIEKFGLSLDTWQYTSPFNITDIRLGQGGYINLEKDNNWYTSTWTSANNIKIYFNDDPNVVSAMFEDGYISATVIPGNQQSRFWANANTRQYMSKYRGYGTQALQLNIDHNSNLNSPLLNENFRNAIAHALDRSRLLKLLNWDSSFPVTTWTLSGGMIKTSDGRIIDNFFAEEYVSGPHSHDYALATIAPINHDAASFKFEAENRHDNRFDPEAARAYLNDFETETQGTGTYTLVFLSADVNNINAAVGIRSMLNEVFGDGKINIKIKSVPQNSYEIMRANGDFDLTTYNFDKYGSEIDSYMKHLFFPDEINPELNKYTGLVDNPAGSWTFHDWYIKHKDELDLYEQYFHIAQTGMSRDVWDELKTILAIDPRKNSQELHEILAPIWSLNNQILNTDERLFKFVAILEKIIALSSPVIPLLDVDNSWLISRLYGIDNAVQYQLQFAYDVTNKPSSALPGRDILINER